jgi:Protein of unknown function (DUF3078)
MRKLFLLAVASVWTLMSIAQDATPKQGWTRGGVFSFNVGQGGSSNWVAGAEKFSLSASGFLNAYANKLRGRHSWDNQLIASYGMINTASQGVRKLDDRLDITSKYGYRLKNPKWTAGVMGNLRTQFSPGYDYTGNVRTRISDLFAPAYLTIAPGFDWKPTSYFSVLISPVSARWIIVTNGPYELQQNLGGKPYNVDPAKGSRFEAGSFASASFNKEIYKNVRYISRLDLYSNFLEQSPEKVDVFWTNAIALKVGRFIQVTYALDLIYDDDAKQLAPRDKVSVGTQIRSLLGVGFSTKF